MYRTKAKQSTLKINGITKINKVVITFIMNFHDIGVVRYNENVFILKIFVKKFKSTIIFFYNLRTFLKKLISMFEIGCLIKIDVL